MTDLLAAASLLTAAVTVLYGLWYPEIARALEMPVPARAADAGPRRHQVRVVLRARVVPLAVLSVCVALVFVPDALGIVSEAVSLVSHEPLAALHYDSRKTAVCLIVVFSLGLALHIVLLAWRTWRLLLRLTPS